MRLIVIVGDGMADYPLKELDYKTPLQAAKPKNMNRLAASGISGMLDPIEAGFAPGSEAAHLSILGYGKNVCVARGPFEAAGAGVKLEPGDLAFRCNFATVNREMILVDERAGRIKDEAALLGREIENVKLKENSNVEVIFRQTLGFKGALVLRGERLSANVSAATMPQVFSTIESIKPLDDSEEAKKTADALNEFIEISHKLIANNPVNLKREANGKMPANIVIPWSGGKPPILKPFLEKYGLKASVVAAASVIKGIGSLCGMSVVNVHGATGELDTDTNAKADAALKAVKTSDFVLVHVEAPDEASHDGNIKGKIKIIKKIDAMVGKILDGIYLEEVAVALMPDHVTSCETRKHTGDPVPISIASGKVTKDGITEFNEEAMHKGGLHRIQGEQVMPLLLNLTGRVTEGPIHEAN